MSQGTKEGGRQRERKRKKERERRKEGKKERKKEGREEEERKDIGNHERDNRTTEKHRETRGSEKRAPSPLLYSPRWGGESIDAITRQISWPW
jgi:hypothetical protein